MSLVIIEGKAETIVLPRLRYSYQNSLEFRTQLWRIYEVSHLGSDSFSHCCNRLQLVGIASSAPHDGRLQVGENPVQVKIAESYLQLWGRIEIYVETIIPIVSAVECGQSSVAESKVERFHLTFC
ncbi:unnamed protein product [Hermetia illucens]|uniref:Uncharacterized protein n=1 Tax=Hermetia illucens TaxID=343691 RepID=A0A7R8UHV4_HERIL|nr:unnamed protein product [Hermetia illucens]